MCWSCLQARYDSRKTLPLYDHFLSSEFSLSPCCRTEVLKCHGAAMSPRQFGIDCRAQNG